MTPGNRRNDPVCEICGPADGRQWALLFPDLEGSLLRVAEYFVPVMSPPSPRLQDPGRPPSCGRASLPASSCASTDEGVCHSNTPESGELFILRGIQSSEKQPLATIDCGRPIRLSYTFNPKAKGSAVGS